MFKIILAVLGALLCGYMGYVTTAEYGMGSFEYGFVIVFSLMLGAVCFMIGDVLDG